MGQVKLPVGLLVWTDFSSLFHISRSKNFKILEVGQVMILRKGKPWNSVWHAEQLSHSTEHISLIRHHGLPIACQLWGVYGEHCGECWPHCVCMRILSTLTWINRLLMKNMNSKHVITLRPEYHGMQFADDPFKSIFLNERYCIFRLILLQFSTQAQIDSKSTLV